MSALLMLWGHMVFGTVAGQRTQLPEEPEVQDSTPSLPETNSSGQSANPTVTADFTGTEQPETILFPDSLPDINLPPDSLRVRRRPVIIGSDAESIQDTTERDSIPPRQPKKFLDDLISGHNKDSLWYSAKKKMIYIYNEGDVTYQDMNLKADYMEVDLETKNIYGRGIATDTLGTISRPEFFQAGSSPITMDTLLFNLETKKAKIKGAATKEGDGFLMGRAIKRNADETFSISQGMYTTCDHIDHPHYYLYMTKAKMIPGEKVIVGPSYMVLEDVPLYFPILPFGFFPITQGRTSGILMPTFGEETRKGFFLREGGYYWAVNDYLDLIMRGGWYTLGSWEANINSRYIKRYTYSGSLYFDFVKSVIGERGDADYQNGQSFSIKWTHQQDPKFRPNSTFSASVNFSTGGYNQYGTNSLQDHLTTQTSSSINYTKSWPGKPFTFSANASHSQNSRDSTYRFDLPNFTFNVSRIFPFKGKNFAGREKWYHKISTQYSGAFKNSVTVKQYDIFKEKMWKDMKNGLEHRIPVKASFTAFNYLNLNPDFTYNEQWHFRKIKREYDPDLGRPVDVDTTYGFFRTYDYSLSVSADTRIYGQFDFTGKDPIIKAVRHVMSPSLSFSFSPDFSSGKYGFVQNIQNNANGDITTYSPYDQNAYSPNTRRKSMSLGFTLGNTLEAKVRSAKDTSGVRKIKILDALNFGGSYNFVAEEFKLSNISANLRTTIIKNFGLNLTATFDPYQLDEDGRRINKFMISKGKLARLTALSTSFNYTFGNGGAGGPAMNNPQNSPLPTPQEQDFFDRNNIDYNTQRMMMTSQYYDFNIPWSLNLSYSFIYRKPTTTTDITQTLTYNASVTLTPKWAVTWSGSYDIAKGKLAPGQVYITRDLHCWQMNLSWIPTGQMQSWAFNISVKSNVLRDLKYDRRSSRYDRLYDQ